MSESVVQAFQALRHLRGRYVFCQEDGTRLTDGNFKRVPVSASVRAGIAKRSWDDLRHTFASHRVIKGVPLRAVQELLGHAAIEMTMRYAHLSPDVKRHAVTLLDEEVLTGRGHPMAPDPGQGPTMRCRLVPVATTKTGPVSTLRAIRWRLLAKLS